MKSLNIKVQGHASISSAQFVLPTQLYDQEQGTLELSLGFPPISVNTCSDPGNVHNMVCYMHTDIHLQLCNFITLNLGLI